MKKNTIATIDAFLLELERLKKKNPEAAKLMAKKSLMSIGIIDENGCLKAPYNGKKVNSDDFTRGPKLIKRK